jgi:hypothetical protein
MRTEAVAVVFVLAACSTKVQQDRAPAQPTVAFPEEWAEGEAAAGQGAPAEGEAEEGQGGAAEGEGEAEKAEAPTDEEAAGPITHVCCESAKATDKGSELSGCKVIEGGAAAQNECLEAGKTFKACEDAQCSQGGCTCSN